MQTNIEVTYIERPADQLANWHQAIQLIAKMIRREIDAMEQNNDLVPVLLHPMALVVGVSDLCDRKT